MRCPTGLTMRRLTGRAVRARHGAVFLVAGLARGFGVLGARPGGPACVGVLCPCGCARVPGGGRGVGHSAPPSRRSCPPRRCHPVRQLSARVRWAAVTALTIAASTGCVSVGDDAGEPVPSRSAGQKEASARPDGGTASGSGRSGSGGGGAEAQSDRGASREPDAEERGSRDPSARPGATRPAPGGPGTPEPTRGGPAPTQEPSDPGPGEPPPEPDTPQEPPPSPEPEPSARPEEPSASPAALSRADAMGAPGTPEAWPTPRVSPQVAPV